MFYYETLPILKLSQSKNFGESVRVKFLPIEIRERKNKGKKRIYYERRIRYERNVPIDRPGLFVAIEDGDLIVIFPKNTNPEKIREKLKQISKHIEELLETTFS